MRCWCRQSLPTPRIDAAARRDALVANIDAAMVAGIPVAQLNTQETRDRGLCRTGPVWGPCPRPRPRRTLTQPWPRTASTKVYTGAPVPVVLAALDVLGSIDSAVYFNQMIDLTLDALSLASIYFLAAIGLAITFGVMRVINMAHGEVYHDGRLYRICRPTDHPGLHGFDHGRAAGGLCGHVRCGRSHGTAGDPVALSPPAGDPAGDLWHIHCASADCQEHLWHLRRVR